MRRAVLLLAVLIAGALAATGTALAKDGDRREARVTATCGPGARAELRLRAQDGAIELELRLRHRPRSTWRVAIVQEHRVVWRGTARTGSSSASLRLRRTLADLGGADAVAVRASGPRGITCDARAVLTAGG